MLAGFTPLTAHAAACCLSASVGGAGRLVVWEDAALGLSTTYGRGTGRYDAQGTFRPLPAGLLEDELRTELWGSLRLGEAWQVSARLPWLVGLRAAPDGTSALGTGPGDVSAAVRWEAVALGEYAELPGVALVLSVTGPTGRRPEEARDPLGASATGRGTWSTGLGVSAEYAWAPSFVRLDLGGVYNAPLRRADTGKRQRFGTALQSNLSAGREVLADRLVLALSVLADHERAMTLEGRVVPDSESTTLAASLSASLKLTPHWSLTGALTSDAPGRLGLAENRPERLSLTTGVRHGFH